MVGRLDQAQQDAFHVFADVTGLGKRGSVNDAERHIQQAGQGPGDLGLAATGGPDQQDVGLVKFEAVFAVLAGHQLLVVVEDRHRHRPLSLVLANDVAVEEFEDLLRRGRGRNGRRRFPTTPVVGYRVVADFHALIADVDVAGAGDQPPHLVLGFAAERAAEDGWSLTNWHALQPLLSTDPTVSRPRCA